ARGSGGRRHRPRARERGRGGVGRECRGRARDGPRSCRARTRARKPPPVAGARSRARRRDGLPARRRAARRHRRRLMDRGARAGSATLLAEHGVGLPLETRGLQMLLTVPASKALPQVLGCFDGKLSLKQLADGSYLIGGGWPALITDEAENQWEVLDDSIAA